jgi:hypothetical protein
MSPSMVAIAYVTESSEGPWSVVWETTDGIRTAEGSWLTALSARRSVQRKWGSDELLWEELGDDWVAYDASFTNEGISNFKK